MLKAGALFVAVTISFVIAVLASLLILLAFHYKTQNRENLLQKKLERNVNSAVVLLMEQGKEIENTVLDLYGEESDSVQIRKSSWGVFEVASVKAFSGRYSLTKAVEYGYKPDETLSPAVYLTDLSRPVNLCGTTKITGTCYFPEAGAKRGYIEGRSFESSDLVKGAIKKSENTLPALDKEMIKKITGYFNETTFSSPLYKQIQFSDSDTLINSFLDSTVLIRLNSEKIVGKYISGNIILYSDKTITIDRGSTLEDVIVIARDIKIKRGFTGNLQAFALDSIVVEDDCTLDYPSALGLYKKDHHTQQPYIKLLENVTFKGMVFTTRSEFVSDQLQTLILLDKKTILTGQLYSDGFADIKGEVRGMVWCNKFLLKTKASVYENHLLDAVIDKSKLSRYYAGSSLLASGKKKKIVKWLY